MESNFEITISDGYVSWKYPLKISDDNSIYDIVRKIFETFEVDYEEGAFDKMIK